MGSLANAKGILGVPVVYPSTDEAHRVLGSTLNNMQTGGLRNTGTKTLNANAISTTVSDVRVGPNSMFAFMATNANGQAALFGGAAPFGHRVSTRTQGSFVLTHASTSTSDATVEFMLCG